MTQLRRGLCPSLAVPMPTGDGLLARLIPAGPIPPGAMVAFCAAARAHGNGIIEITTRGSVQVRGLRPDSAPLFAAEVAALGITAQEGVPVIAPVDGGPAELLAAQLRGAIAAARLALSPKVCVVVDGGGAFNLDTLSADVRLLVIEANPDRPSATPRCHLGLGCHRRDQDAAPARSPSALMNDGNRHRPLSSAGESAAPSGDAAATTWLGVVAPQDAVAAVTGILTMVAARGPAARVADILARDGAAAFRTIAAVEPAPPPPRRTPANVVGLHAMRDGTMALGIALPFGHAHADALTQLVGIAARCGVHAVRPAPHRALLLDGVSTRSARALLIAAEHHGFVVRADDPRRRIAACPGRPACASGLIPARTLAAALAPLAAPIAGRHGVVIHVSGCPKGCAHPAPAALTVVGAPQGCAVIHNGGAGDVPHHYVDPARLGDEIKRLAPGFLAPASAEAAHD